MIGLLQRVSEANVSVDNKAVAKISIGLLVLIGIERDDGKKQANRLLQRLLNYRVFNDADGKMNCSLKDINGGLLFVPQFTLPADTRKGQRPSFSPAADPVSGKHLYDYLVTRARQDYVNVQSGIFAADMKVSLINDGPVTFWLQTNPDKA